VPAKERGKVLRPAGGGTIANHYALHNRASPAAGYTADNERTSLMSSILNYNYRIFIASTLAIAIGAVTASAHPLVNPGFDNSSPGPGAVGGFTSVVGPPFSPGFWGAENSTIVATGGFVDPVTPLSSPYMLEMSDAGGTLTEAWQVVNVAGDLPPNSSVDSALGSLSQVTVSGRKPACKCGLLPLEPCGPIRAGIGAHHPRSTVPD
jgi:hypothetical protein